MQQERSICMNRRLTRASDNRTLPSRLLRGALRYGFTQFYTRFAWTYDAVAAAVSLGEWQQWGGVAMQFLQPPLRVLEVGFGPGHLHLALRRAGCNAAGIDLSPQMCRMASHRLRRAGLSNTLARGSVFALPFAADTFDAVVSTFPTEFIFAAQMHREAWRVLRDGGRLIVIPTITLRHPLWRALFRHSRAAAYPDARAMFEVAGFAFSEQKTATPRATVVTWLAQK